MKIYIIRYSVVAIVIVTIFIVVLMEGFGQRVKFAEYGPGEVLSLTGLVLEIENGEEKSAGDATVKDTLRNSFGRVLLNLSDHKNRWPYFRASKLLFDRDWSDMQRENSLAGPLFNAPACKNCHERDGRGRPPLEEGEMPESIVVQVSVLEGGIARPHPLYGEQLKYHGLDEMPGDGSVKITYREITGRFADGEQFTLVAPEYTFINLAHGALGGNVRYSPRVAPPTFGLGLIEAIPAHAILANADPDDRDGNGISGRPNYVRDAGTGRLALGRFGWKANQPNLGQQIASAFFHDIGITSRLFPGDAPYARTAGNSPGVIELSDARFDSVLFYMRLLAAPARRNWDKPTVLRGKAIFKEIGCAGCHIPRFETGVVQDFPELSRQIIRPYTDLLLHDMGEGLADRRPDGLATGREWRTPPLWGIGLVGNVNLHTRFLHDGRARNLEEAVLWHGGEGERSRDLYRRLVKNDRSALIAFLESL